jgi:CRISPR-associated protein Cmr4
MNNAQLTFIHALSPLHAGVGQGAGVIDLPIAREKGTGLPFLPGSSLKGALRTRGIVMDKENSRDWQKIFGAADAPEQDNSYQAGQVQFTDQRLLLLPVRSLAGTFAWVTSPFILHRLVRDVTDAELSIPEKQFPQPTRWQDCYITDGPGNALLFPSKPGGKQAQKVYLEDLDLHAQQHPILTSLAQWLGKQIFPGAHNTEWRLMLRQRLCLVHDDILSFLVTTGTEITARIRLEEESKTVQQGGLWYEEALPAETILSGLVLTTPIKKYNMGPQAIFALMHRLNLIDQPLQLGGKSTVGRGLCRIRLSGGEA